MDLPVRRGLQAPQMPASLRYAKPANITLKTPDSHFWEE